MTSSPRSLAAFAGHRLLAHGPEAEVAAAIRRALDGGETAPVLAFDDADGRVVDLDLRGQEAPTPPPPAAGPARGRGRPKLGVVAREVTLLPRHWDWLAAQPGGASVALRKLVEAARRDPAAHRAAARDAAYRFMSALAGDMAGFEEASRALFAGDREQLAERTAAWPPDVRGHLFALLDRNGADD